nr:RNA-directed DNA polymerase, eukaryota [Tanacetum cinerariifolium]
TLLKSVLRSMPIYHMSLFKVPKKVLHRMESMRSHFFNGAELSSKKLVWVKWNHALASKDKGGLGVSSLFALNRALMFKWVWHFITQGSSLWHGYDGKIGQKVKSCYPSLWLDIMRWRCLSLVVWCRNTAIRAYEGESGGCILADMVDRWFWALEGLGKFTITSVRKMIDEFMLPEVSSKTRWIKAVPIKVNVHAWKVKLVGLPTRLNISRRGIDIESILRLMCGKAIESTSHIFFTCQMSKEILRTISRWWDIDYMKISSYEEWLDWILNTRLSVKSKQLFEGVCYVLWCHSRTTSTTDPPSSPSSTPPCCHHPPISPQPPSHHHLLLATMKGINLRKYTIENSFTLASTKEADKVKILQSCNDYVNDDSNFYGCAGLRDDFRSSEFTIYEMMKGNCVGRLGERADDSFLVINLSRKVVEYNLISKKLCDMYDMGYSQVTDDYHDGFISSFAMYDM